MENKWGTGMFMGNDEEYGSPYNHRYNDRESDRGSSDEGWEYKTDQYNPYSPNGEAKRRFRMKSGKW
jgi:hypothetical protein